MGFVVHLGKTHDKYMNLSRVRNETHGKVFFKKITVVLHLLEMWKVKKNTSVCGEENTRQTRSLSCVFSGARQKACLPCVFLPCIFLLCARNKRTSKILTHDKRRFSRSDCCSRKQRDSCRSNLWARTAVTALSRCPGPGGLDGPAEFGWAGAKRAC
jgi:hypothetical protein